MYKTKYMLPKKANLINMNDIMSKLDVCLVYIVTGRIS